jgi:hypothetical protein
LVHADFEDAIDHTKDHSRAMKMLEDAGIHVLFVSLPTHLEFQLRLVFCLTKPANRLTIFPDNLTSLPLHLSHGSPGFVQA